MKFKIGDEVIIIKDYEAAHKGMIGVIKHIIYDPVGIGIEFSKIIESGRNEEFWRLHELFGNGKSDSCYYLPKTGGYFDYNIVKLTKKQVKEVLKIESMFDGI